MCLACFTSLVVFVAALLESGFLSNDAPRLFRGARADALPMVWLRHGTQHRRGAVRGLQHVVYGATSPKWHVEGADLGASGSERLR